VDKDDEAWASEVLPTLLLQSVGKPWRRR
jgi:hypothetical protein